MRELQNLSWVKWKEPSEFKSWCDPTKEVADHFPHCFIPKLVHAADPVIAQEFRDLLDQVEEWGHDHIGNYNRDWFRFDYRFYFAKEEHALMFMMRWT